MFVTKVVVVLFSGWPLEAYAQALRMAKLINHHPLSIVGAYKGDIKFFRPIEIISGDAR